jgi:hypothetical protein
VIWFGYWVPRKNSEEIIYFLHCSEKRLKKVRKTVKKSFIFFTVFTRCDVVGTWSREYQLSSSSHSHSYSYSPDNSLFFGFYQVRQNLKQLFDNFLTTFWQLFDIFFDNFLTTFWQLFDNILTTCWQLFDNYLTTFWQFFVQFLTIFDNFFDNFWQLFWLFFLMVVASCRNKYYGTNFISAVPTSLLIAPGLW